MYLITWCTSENDEVCTILKPAYHTYKTLFHSETVPNANLKWGWVWVWTPPLENFDLKFIYQCYQNKALNFQQETRTSLPLKITESVPKLWMLYWSYNNHTICASFWVNNVLHTWCLDECLGIEHSNISLHIVHRYSWREKYDS